MGYETERETKEKTDDNDVILQSKYFGQRKGNPIGKKPAHHKEQLFK